MSVTSRPIAFCIAALLLAACTADPADPTEQAATPSDAASAQPETTAPTGAEQPTEPANPPIAAETGLDVDGDCTAEALQDEAGLYVGADLDVTNTGNIGTRARVSVAWPAKGTRLAKARFVRLRPGRSKSVSIRLALTQEDADAIARAVGNGRRCRINTRVVGAFGAPVED